MLIQKQNKCIYIYVYIYIYIQRIQINIYDILTKACYTPVPINCIEITWIIVLKF